MIDLYKTLFGRKGIQDGNVIELSEHGRQGGQSSKHGLKYVEDVAIALRVDEASDTITYIGKSYPGASTGDTVWQILKIDTSSGTSLVWADGNDNYDNEWDERASYTYS